MLTEKQQLATQLQVAEAEKRLVAEQAAQMRQEVQVERAEKTRLAEGVKLLAAKSGELAAEIREHRPLAPNLIFSEFVSNRVQARFEAFRSGFLGLDTDRRRDTGTVLFTDGINTYALCHVHDTPLVLTDPGMDWESLTGTLSFGNTALPIRSLSFCDLDPRIVLIPLAPEEALQLNSKVYRLSADPFKFQDAVLVGAREGYYGECQFQIDLSTPRLRAVGPEFHQRALRQIQSLARRPGLQQTGRPVGRHGQWHLLPHAAQPRYGRHAPIRPGRPPPAYRQNSGAALCPGVSDALQAAVRKAGRHRPGSATHSDHLRSPAITATELLGV